MYKQNVFSGQSMIIGRAALLLATVVRLVVVGCAAGYGAAEAQAYIEKKTAIYKQLADQIK